MVGRGGGGKENLKGKQEAIPSLPLVTDRKGKKRGIPDAELGRLQGGEGGEKKE